NTSSMARCFRRTSASRAAARSLHRPPNQGTAPISLSDREPPPTVASRGIAGDRPRSGVLTSRQKWRYSRTPDLRGPRVGNVEPYEGHLRVCDDQDTAAHKGPRSLRPHRG